MNISEFVSRLKIQDVRLSAEGDRLRINAPKGVLTDNLRSQIAERKQEVLKFLRDLNASAASIPSPISWKATGIPRPLSFAQERLWFLEQLEPGSSVYNICRAVRITGPLKKNAVKSSLDEVIRRHEVLRTTFGVIDGCPMQTVAPEVSLKISSTDLRRFTPDHREHQVRRLISVEARRPFTFSMAPLLRARLVQLNKQDFVLILTTHHIVSDAWSMGILSRELWTFYENYARGVSPNLENLPFHYADYSIWQREWLEREVLKSRLLYWKEQLKNSPLCLDLPTDHVRPIKQSFAGSSVPLVLPEALTETLNELSRRAGVTLFMTLLTAFKILLFRYTSEEDVCVGSPVANRNTPWLEGLVGFFVNTVVIRTNLSGNPSFQELLSRVRDSCLGAYERQDLPFEKLVEALQPARDLSRNPIFQVMFQLQNAPRHIPSVSGLAFEPIAVESHTSKFDLTLAFAERNARLSGFIEYNTDLFCRSRIERMAGHFRTLLEGVVGDPDQSISTLPILTEHERDQLLVAWNDTEADYPKHLCIHQLFETQVEQTPNSTAIQSEYGSLTYRELNRRANCISHYLRRLGVRPGSFVGICAERSVDMVVGLLGILKADGAYVPLEPSYPKERIRFMLADSKASVLLTQRKFSSNFGDFDGSVIAIDDPHFWENLRNGNPNCTALPSDPAYLIYTSGSTGVPKGVIGLHSGAVNRMAWMWKAYPFERNEKSCLKTSLSFVDSVWECFGPLLRGVPSLIISDETVRDPDALLRTVADHRVTRIVLVPSLLEVIVDQVPDFQQVLVHRIIWTSSGERLSSALANKFRNRFPNSLLLNLYGSSEVSGDVTHENVSQMLNEAVIPIGRPISNIKIYLLDCHRQLVPVGVPGELYVGGTGLARGYLNRPELTLEKFSVVEPFSSDSDARLYRSGDLARYQSDGNIEFLGRIDRQVKLRGRRIEVGEIEFVLNQHPKIRQCVVFTDAEARGKQRREQSPNGAIDDLEQEMRLLAYIVPFEQPSLQITELRSFLKHKLPDHMIPSTFISVEALPLTANGKIDINALPRPNLSRPELDHVYVEPKTEIEELVAQVWRDVLKLEKVGGADNFFELGGHSLLAVQIVSRLRGVFDREIPLRALFEAPTLAAFSSEIKSIIRHGMTREPPPIACLPGEATGPLTLSQEQLQQLDRLLPDASMFNMFFVFELTGSLNIEALQSALVEIVRRHGALRTVFAVDSDQPMQVIKELSEFRLQVIDPRVGRSSDLLERVATLILQESSRPFDLAVGPLFRTQLVKLADQEHLLLISLHHIVGDQWSMRLFRRELAALYDAFSQGRQSPLPIPLIRFIDYARWQRQMLEEGLWDGQLTFWRKQLAGPLSKLRFEGAREKTISLNFRVARQSFEFDEDRLVAIKNLAKEEGCTPYMVVLAALNSLLYFYTSQHDLRIGTLMANRGQRDTENVIGHFLNTTILRISLDPDWRVKQLLKQVRDMTVAAQANQELPFEHVVRTFGLAESPNRETLCQVLCNYQNLADDSLVMPGLKIAFWNATSMGAAPNVMFTTFDLIFHFRQTSTKLSLTVNYKTQTFGKRMISGLIKNYDRILKVITGRPGDVLSSLLLDAGLQRPRISHRAVRRVNQRK